MLPLRVVGRAPRGEPRYDRHVRCALLAAIAGAVLASPAAAATAVVTTSGQPISAVAAGAPSGALIACGRVSSVPPPAPGPLLGRYAGATCYASPLSDAGPLARAGGRTAWIVRGGGATLESTLVIAKAPGAAATQAAAASAPDEVGREVRDVVADGTAFLWSVVRNDAAAVTTLRRSPASGPVTTVVTLAGQARLLAAGQNRIVVLDGSARVALLDGAGTIVRDLGGGPVRGAAVAGGVVYVLRSRRIDLHTLGGSTIRSLPLAATAREGSTLVVRSGVAVYTTTRGVRVVRIASGRDVLVALGPEPGTVTDRGLVGAAIDEDGILYAVNDRCSNRHVCRGRVLRAPVPAP